MIKQSRQIQKYDQKHIMDFYNQLNETKKEELEKNIKTVDFSLMNKLYKNSFKNETININKISALKCITDIPINIKKKYEKIGRNLVKNNEYAVVILAGGDGSRLGFNGPKGCLILSANNKKISLFELFINQLKKIYEEFNVYINIYIMTSKSNYNATVEFFEKKIYNNYPKEKIHFFVQEELPILDVNGKILLKDKSKILFGPNGNGNVFRALRKSKMILDMKQRKIKYVLFSTVDNVLTNLVDFTFIGSTIANNYKLSSKTLFKENENEKDWIFCKYKNRPFMLPSEYITTELTNVKDAERNYIFRGKNITYHLITIDLIEKISKKKLKYHRAYKKNNYMNKDGKLIIADTQNSFKFEQFIFDSFYYGKDMLLYKISKNEFCPIKSAEDVEKAEKALEKML